MDTVRPLRGARRRRNGQDPFWCRRSSGEIMTRPSNGGCRSRGYTMSRIPQNGLSRAFGYASSATRMSSNFAKRFRRRSGEGTQSRLQAGATGTVRGTGSRPGLPRRRGACDRRAVCSSGASAQASGRCRRRGLPGAPRGRARRLPRCARRGAGRTASARRHRAPRLRRGVGASSASLGVRARRGARAPRAT